MSTKTSGRKKAEQQTLELRQRGGRREGAGRKPKGAKARVSHAKREALPRRCPIHVTLRVGKGVRNLRAERALRVIRSAFDMGKDRFGMRLTQFSVQGNHIHLIVEAESNDALTRGMKGLVVRLARGLNRLMG